MRTASDDIRAYDEYCDNLNEPPQDEAAMQTELPLEYSGEVESAFSDGRLSIIVDDERSLNPHLSFMNRPVKWDGHGAIVHVVSKPAGGEIRGYVLIDGALHLRLPNYAGEWPELDAAVERRLNARRAA